MSELNTFSIVARCPHSGAFGVAVATAVPAVGSMCPYLRPGVGAVSTQSWVNPYLAGAALDRLAAGLGAEATLASVLATDDRTDLRQFGVVGPDGDGAAWTGSGCTGWAGHRTGPGYAIQGNMLTGPDVIDAMAAEFEGSAALALDERLMLALEAGDRIGGDKRGKQSAALKIVEREDYALLDLRVDEHADPVPELRRVLGVARLQLVPFIAGMPKKAEAAGELPAYVVAMLLASPPDRPGGGGAAPSFAASTPAAPDLMREVIGLTVAPERAQTLLARFAPVLEEIEKLRGLDLRDVHPPIVFDPTLPYRQTSADRQGPA